MNYRRIASIVGLVVLLAFVVPFAVYAVPGMIGANHSFVVLSGSMEPEISPGDVVIVEETDPETIGEGDVVTFAEADGDTPVTHRVVGIVERGDTVAFETQGDANPEPDSTPVPGENVIGSVVLTIPFIGYVIQFANTTVGFALLVGLPIGLLLLSEVWTFVNAAKKASKPSSPSESDRGTVSSSEAGSTSDAEPIETEPVKTEADDEVTIDVTDLTSTLVVLLLAVPYTIYVALQLQSVMSITVAFAVAFSTFALGWLWLSARFAGTETEEQTKLEWNAGGLTPPERTVDSEIDFGGRKSIQECSAPEYSLPQADLVQILNPSNQSIVFESEPTSDDSRESFTCVEDLDVESQSTDGGSPERSEGSE